MNDDPYNQPRDPWAAEPRITEPLTAPIDPHDTSEPDPTMACWRCQLLTPATLSRCPHCSARLRTTTEVTGSEPLSEPTNSRGWDDVRPPLVSFVWLLIVSIGMGFAILAVGPNAQPDVLLGIQIVFKVIHTLFVLIAWKSTRPVHLPTSPFRRRAWLLALPVLAVCLLVNIGSSTLMNDFVQLPARLQREPDKLTVVTLGTGCLQPAVVEELFFRYLLLGAFWRVMSPRGAVWVSAAAFAICHVYNPLAMPYLFLFGGVLGYARVWSNGVVLPMVMHFLHNFVILALEGLV
jgi:uncharacterized protein